MRAVVEDIAGGGVDGDGTRVGRGVWVLPVGGSQSLASAYHEA